MKLVIVLITIGILHVSAAGYGQSITLSEQHASLENIINQIRTQSGYDFLGDTRLIRSAKPVSINVKEASIEETLSICFKGQALTWSLENKIVVIRQKDKTLADETLNLVQGLFQDIDVHGTVTDEKGEPMPGATIKVKGTSVSAITDALGVFQLKGLKDNSHLVISYLGYQNKEILIIQSGPVTIKMEILSSELATVDIVNTGYQRLSKERSAGSFSKPDMNIVKNRTGSMDILQRLDGLVPGLTVNNAPNTPIGGTRSSSILVRGLTTIGISDPGTGSYTGGGTNRNPLYVVDGIPLDDVSSINPQDVEDVTVLKDATASSIWGARASNGVIVITTKKGSLNEKVKVDYDGFVNFQGKPDFNAIPTLNSRQFVQAAKEVFNSPGYFDSHPWEVVSDYDPSSPYTGGIAPHEQILYDQHRGIISDALANSRLDSLGAIDNRSQINDLWYRNAVLMNHTVSLSGGGKVYSFYGSLAGTNAQSDRPGEKNNTYKVNLRQDFTLNKNISLYLITDLTSTNTSAKRNIDVDHNFYPYQLFRDGNGKNIAMPYMTSLSDSTRLVYQDQSGVNLDYVPLDDFNSGYTNTDGMLARITGGVTVKLMKGLRFEGVYGFLKGSNKTTSYDDGKSYLVRSELAQFTLPGDPPEYYLPATGGRYRVSNADQQNYTLRNQLIYDNSWNNSLHQLTLLVGQEAQEQFSNTNGSMVRGYNEALQTIGDVDYKALSSGLIFPVFANSGFLSVLSGNPFTQSEFRSRFTSYYANAAYTYNRKYSINGSWRIDQSNLYGVDKSAQNRPVWSAGVKWLLSGEDFMDGQRNWLNDLALRATYGRTGNSPVPGPSTATSHDVMAPNSSIILPNGQGLTIVSPANKKLTWESTNTFNLGVDFGVLNSRINGSIDLYQKKTDNLLGNYAVNAFTGYDLINGNMGSMENKGVEVSLQSRNIQTKNFSWSTGFVMAYNKNLVTKLASNIPISTGEQKITQSFLPGYAAFAVFAYKYAGLDAMGDPQIRLADGSVTKKENSTKPEDVAYIGTYQPVWNGGLSNNFTYKGFGLAFNMVYNFGNVMRRAPNDFYTGRLSERSVFGGNTASAFGGNLNAEFADRWKKPGDEAFTDIPAYVGNSADNDSRRNIGYYLSSDVNVVSAAYVKMRDITLSYSLPASILKDLRISGVSFRVQVSNLMLWKANKYGIDPEFQNTLTDTRMIPTDQGTISLGAHVTF